MNGRLDVRPYLFADLIQRGELLAIIVHVKVGHRFVAAALDGSRAVRRLLLNDDSFIIIFFDARYIGRYRFSRKAGVRYFVCGGVVQVRVKILLLRFGDSSVSMMMMMMMVMIHHTIAGGRRPGSTSPGPLLLTTS